MSRDRASSDQQLGLALEPSTKPASRPPAHRRPRNTSPWTPSSDHDTSREAAGHLAKTGLAGKVQRQVLASIVDNDATAQQLEQRLGVAGNMIRPRIRELETLRFIEHVGNYRKAPSGRRAKVYLRALEGGPHGSK